MQHPLMGDTPMKGSSCTFIEGEIWACLPCKFVRCKAPWSGTMELSHLASKSDITVYSASFEVTSLLCARVKNAVIQGAFDAISTFISGIEALQHCRKRAADGTSFGYHPCPLKGLAPTDKDCCDLRDC